ncbi:MAG: hypothetical protein RJB43_1058, partial [Verrucomicrobiota bacterium]
MIEQGGLVGRTGLADQLDPRTGASGVDLATHEEALHVGRGDAGVDRLHDGIQRGFLAIDLGRLSGDVLEPRTGEFVNARPGGEIEEGVLGILREMREHGAGAFRSADAGEGAVGFELHARIDVGEERSDQADIRRAPGAEGFAEFAQSDLEAHRILAFQEFGEVRGVVGTAAEQPGGVTSRGVVRGPILEGGLQFGDGELGEFAAGLFESPAVGREEIGEELLGRFAEDRLPSEGLGGFRHDAPDATADLIAARITEVDLTMVDDGVGPVSDVECAVWAHLDGDRTEGDVAGADDIGKLLGHVARLRRGFGAEVVEAEADDAMRAEVARDRVALPIGSEDRAVDEFESAELRIRARADAADEATGAFGGREGRAGEGPVHAGAIGARSEEGLTGGVFLLAPGVDESLGVDFEA